MGRHRPGRTRLLPGKAALTPGAVARLYEGGMHTLVSVFLFTAIGLAQTEFWAPVTPPRAHYAIDVKFVADTSRLEGTETIRFRNDTGRPIGRIALEWYGDVLRVQANGVPAERSRGKHSVALFDLPRDVEPGDEVELSVDFGAPWKLDPRNGSAVTSFLSPRLWWGFGTLDDYEVRVHAPDGYTVATSGRYDSRAGAYRAEGVRIFGLFVGKGYESAEADAGDVRIRAVFTAAGRPCAELLLKTAIDVIGFYRERFGFYPQRSLAIVPGMDYPAGGYPPATGLVVIHGQERLSERPEPFWRWITAHEIGHMYWGDYVLARGPDSLSWLMIGLGIHADREYRRARDIKGGVGALELDYVSAVKRGLDTTLDVTEEQRAAIQWDVDHGKSAALLNALESVIGAETFASVYCRCLKEYAGKQLGWQEFQRVAEAESRQDLGWFFEQWVRSSGSAAYRVAGQECSPAGDEFICTVRVERLGAMRMPVTVAARFEYGSEQRVRTERLADLDELKFRAKSPLKEVVIEPDSAVALAEAPPAAQRELMAKIRLIPWTGAAEAALEAYRQAREMKIEDAGIWGKLGLMLYDGRYYQEALAVMTQLASSDSDWRFAALVWQGHLLDLLGRRAEAVARYQEALKFPGSPRMQHDQYKFVINKQWVEDRLKTPFERR
jgi:tetratricopeptide (TPR) repeat protein